MVSTRTKTNSLPEKKSTYAELQAAEDEEKRRRTAAKAKSGLAKPKPVPASNPKEKQEIKARNPKRADATPEPINDGKAKLKQTGEAAKSKRAAVKAELVCGTKRAKTQHVSTPGVPYIVQHTTTASTGEGATTFLDLPSELRNEIYSCALPMSLTISVRNVQPYVLEPALCAVSHQVRSESLTMFYGDNIFEVKGSSPAVKFLRSMSDQQLRSLRTLHISCDVLRPIGEAQERIKHHLLEFGGRGLRRQAIRFCVIDGEERVWANLEKLKRIAEDG